MIQGVGALHSENLVHKDIKTPNILINGDMKVVVCDFGLVEKVPKDGTITRGGGTPSTWAPEVASK
jgi:serine/threonine protein kinase